MAICSFHMFYFIYCVYVLKGLTCPSATCRCLKRFVFSFKIKLALFFNVLLSTNSLKCPHGQITKQGYWAQAQGLEGVSGAPGGCLQNVPESDTKSTKRRHTTTRERNDGRPKMATERHKTTTKRVMVIKSV